MQASRVQAIKKYNLDRLILYMKGRTFDIPGGLSDGIIFTPDPEKHPPIRSKGILDYHNIDLSKFDVATGYLYIPFYSSSKYRVLGSFQPCLPLVFEERPLSDLNHKNIAFAWFDNCFLAHLSVLNPDEFIDLIEKLDEEDPELCKQFCNFMLWQAYYNPNQGNSSF